MRVSRGVDRIVVPVCVSELVVQKFAFTRRNSGTIPSFRCIGELLRDDRVVEDFARSMKLTETMHGEGEEGC
jgi:hypothetical protein